jgi:hypothetical protein
MVGVIAHKNTDRVGGTTCAAACDLRAKASAFYFTGGEYGLLGAFYDNATDAVRAMGYIGCPRDPPLSRCPNS